MVKLNTVTLKARTEQKALSLAQPENPLTCLVSLTACGLPSDRVSDPLFLVAVLDKSGSMSGSKIRMLKDTMHRLIAKLRAVDRLAIVAYDTHVSVLLKPSYMDEHGLSTANALIDSIHVGSSTNLSGGLLEGLNLVPKDLPSNTVVSTLLLTDGLVNIGVSTTEGIILLMKNLWEKTNGPRKSAVYTFGYGSDHNSSMLKEIATAGDGLYYYIENEDRIADCFADVLAGLLSVVAQTLTLTIEASPDVNISEFYTEYPQTVITPGSKIRVTLADIQAEESRDFPISLNVPAVTGATSSPLLQISLDYFDSLSNSIVNYSTELNIPRLPESELTPELVQYDVEINSHVNRIRTCQILKEAKTLADKGDFDKARKLINDQIESISNSPSVEAPLCERLILDLKTALETLVDSQRYRSEGSHRMVNCFDSHSHQRAAPQSSEIEMMNYTYCNSSRFTMYQNF